MLVVLTLSSCPPSLRGDMTKWLLEIETGVYVGRVTARVKDMLWDRVIHSLEEGRAVLVHSSKSEQHFDILVPTVSQSRGLSNLRFSMFY